MNSNGNFSIASTAMAIAGSAEIQPIVRKHIKTAWPRAENKAYRVFMRRRAR